MCNEAEAVYGQIYAGKSARGYITPNKVSKTPLPSPLPHSETWPQLCIAWLKVIHLELGIRTGWHLICRAGPFPF